jgi:hypothetical protein
MPIQLEFRVVMDGGKEHNVVADQRDLARWQVQDFAADKGRDIVMVRFLGWSAMTRQGLTKASWDTFNEIDCVDVSDVSGAEGDDESLDPGQPGASGTGSSTSPRSAGRRSRDRAV